MEFDHNKSEKIVYCIIAVILCHSSVLSVKDSGKVVSILDFYFCRVDFFKI